MSDPDAEYVVTTCMGVVQRKQDHGWFAAWSTTQRVTMFEDIDVSVMVQLVMRVIIEEPWPFLVRTAP
ncbi:phage tail assembly chaperone [Cupriavidus basilensis]